MRRRRMDGRTETMKLNLDGGTSTRCQVSVSQLSTPEPFDASITSTISFVLRILIFSTRSSV